MRISILNGTDPPQPLKGCFVQGQNKRKVLYVSAVLVRYDKDSHGKPIEVEVYNYCAGGSYASYTRWENEEDRYKPGYYFVRQGK